MVKASLFIGGKIVSPGLLNRRCLRPRPPNHGCPWIQTFPKEATVMLGSVTGPVGRIVLVRCEPQYQYRKRQNQNCPCHYEKIFPRLVFSAPNLDQDPAQRCHRDINQVANRKPGRLEIDSDRCADFKIDKQKKDIRKFSASLT